MELGFAKTTVLEAQKAGQVDYDYLISGDKCFIFPKKLDEKMLMSVVAGLVLVGLRHINIRPDKIIVYFDDVVSLEI